MPLAGTIGDFFTSASPFSNVLNMTTDILKRQPCKIVLKASQSISQESNILNQLIDTPIEKTYFSEYEEPINYLVGLPTPLLPNLTLETHKLMGNSCFREIWGFFSINISTMVS